MPGVISYEQLKLASGTTTEESDAILLVRRFLAAHSHFNRALKRFLTAR